MARLKYVRRAVNFSFSNLFAAFAAKFDSRRHNRATNRTFSLCRLVQIGSGFVTELYILGHFRSTRRADLHRHGSTAVVAKLAGSHRLTANRTYGGFALDLARPYDSSFGALINIALHGLGFLHRIVCCRI